VKQAHNPPEIIVPVGPLSWGIETPPARRLFFVSGQVGSDRDGAVPEGFIAQSQLVWQNIGAVLTSAGLTARHIVRTGIYLAPQVDFSGDLKTEFNRLRADFLGDPPPASTLIFVHRLMDPRWLVEIDAIALEPI
jgi:enamine deaminase RidA (YjgF/YER057c/UK114 family)